MYEDGVSITPSTQSSTLVMPLSGNRWTVSEAATVTFTVPLTDWPSVGLTMLTEGRDVFVIRSKDCDTLALAKEVSLADSARKTYSLFAASPASWTVCCWPTVVSLAICQLNVEPTQAYSTRPAVLAELLHARVYRGIRHWRHADDSERFTGARSNLPCLRCGRIAVRVPRHDPIRVCDTGICDR